MTPQAKLQSFLGPDELPTTLSSQVSSTKTTFLHEQLAKWDWNPSIDSSLPVSQSLDLPDSAQCYLVYYNRSKTVVVQTDASEYWLGATLLKSGHPIAFASNTLTDVETHYANIEHECLLVCLQSGEATSAYILWQACHSREWPQATGNDTTKAYPYSSPCASAHASAYAEVWLHHKVQVPARTWS